MNRNSPGFFTLRSGGSPLIPYALAWEFQKALVERRVRDEIPDTFLFVEHPSTITRGRGLQRKPGDDSEVRAMPMDTIPPAPSISKSSGEGTSPGTVRVSSSSIRS